MRGFGHFADSAEGFSRVLRRLCPHTSECNLKLRRRLSVSVYCLHAFPSALGFVPCSLSGLHFYSPRTFVFLFFLRTEWGKKRKKKKRLRIAGTLCHRQTQALPSSSLLFVSFLFALSLSLRRPSGRPVLAQSNPTAGSEPEFDARNRTPFVPQACSETLCTCHT